MSKIEKNILLALLFLSGASMSCFLFSEFKTLTTDNILSINYGIQEFFLFILFFSLFGCLTYLKNTNLQNEHKKYFKYYMGSLSITPVAIGLIDFNIFSLVLNSILSSFIVASVLEYFILSFLKSLGFEIKYRQLLEKIYSNKLFVVLGKMAIYFILGIATLLYILSRYSWH
jgi:hypothetical protein